MEKDSSESISIRISRVLPAKKWKVLRQITRVQNFPRFMPNVKQCTVLEKLPSGVITCWNVEVDHIPISWKERDEFDFPKFTIRFKAIEGDFEEFEGKWVLKDHPSGGTEVLVEVRARIGIPMVATIVGKMLTENVSKNFELILNGIEEILTTQRYKGVSNRRRSDVEGFAVIGHPYNFQHLIRYFKHFKPDMKLPSQQFIAKLFELTPAYKSFDIKGFRSSTGKTVDGYFVMCPIIPDMLKLSPERVVAKVIEACRVSERLGVGIVALGGFTSIAGEQYSRELVSKVNVPVTTGNTFTVALTLDGIYKAAELMQIRLENSRVTVIGGTGDIGGAVARILSRGVAEITLTSRSEKNLLEMERVLSYCGKAEVKTTRDSNEAIKQADIILAAASVSSSFIDFNNFKPGAIICDVGYPKNISYTLCNRKDIFIFSGGITKLPSEFNLGFDIGMPTPQVLYGCFAEAVLLALEDRYENFSWGKGTISREKVDFIREVASKHGFGLAPFFWGNRLMKEDEINQIYKNARSAYARNTR